MNLSPITRRNISRIVPFAIIWLLAGWVFILVEIAAMGTPDPDSPTIIGLNWQVFIFASIAVLIVGWLVGTIETLYVERLFRDRNFLQKIIYKLGLYALIMLVIIVLAYPIAASLEEGIPLFDSRVWRRFNEFVFSITFASTLLQMAFSTTLCLLYAGVSENIGHHVFLNFLTGKYHRPREEKRIFMFLDMKDSTMIAERLGHVRYFDLLKDYYSDLSQSIINHLGEVYQYVGDEVVISWNYKKGLKHGNCVKCFFAMKEALKHRGRYYQNTYGFIPSFKAGIHMGNVTTGEIGALKKEIFFTGDVLNTTSRIQGLCNKFSADLLASEELHNSLELDTTYTITSFGTIELKGRKEPIGLVSIQFK